MEQTYFTIYKITNQLNGKIYSGSHKTKKLDDKNERTYQPKI